MTEQNTAPQNRKTTTRRNWLIGIGTMLLLTLAFVYWLARQSTYTVTINAPIEAVWDYASDSSKAVEWSVFFTHIESLPGIEDGKVGSLRRCFRRHDETGVMWDEEVVEIRPLEYRQIRTFNIRGFNDPQFEDVEFKVEQHYEKIDETTSRLTFSSELKEPMNPMVILKLLFTVSEGRRIFRLNLENIKAAIEAGEHYQRPHPYEPENRFDP